MQMFAATIIVLGAAIAFHVVLHRVMLMTGKTGPGITVVYPLGLAVLLAVSGAIPGGSLFWSSILFYVCSSLVLFFLYLSICLGRETPAAMILQAFDHKRRMTIADIRNLFTRKGLFDDRLTDLTRAGFIREIDGSLSVTRTGRVLIVLDRLYRLVLHGGSV